MVLTIWGLILFVIHSFNSNINNYSGLQSVMHYLTILGDIILITTGIISHYLHCINKKLGYFYSLKLEQQYRLKQKKEKLREQFKESIAKQNSNIDEIEKNRIEDIGKKTLFSKMEIGLIIIGILTILLIGFLSLAGIGSK